MQLYLGVSEQEMPEENDETTINQSASFNSYFD
jgi:hypothetical protein